MFPEGLGCGSLNIVAARSIDAVGRLDVPVSGEIGEDFQRNTGGHSLADEAVAQGVGRCSLDAGSLAEGAPCPGDALEGLARSCPDEHVGVVG